MNQELTQEEKKEAISNMPQVDGHKLAKMQAVSSYVGELRAKIGLYLGWIPNEFADLAAQNNAYQLLKDDIEVSRCLHLHSCMAAGEKIRVKSKKGEIIKILVEKFLSQISDFVHARKSLLENGALFGLGLQKKNYVVKEFDFSPGISWVVISDILEVDTRRLRIERCPFDNNVLYWTIYRPDVDQYVKILDRNEFPEQPDGDGLQDYIWYFHERDELNPYFRGYGTVLYKLVYIRDRVMQYWADLCESWAKPFITVAADILKGVISAGLGTDIETIEKRVSDWLAAFEAARARHVLIHDKADEINILEHGTTGNNIVRELLTYLDEKITLLILGAELTTGTGAGVGSYALGNVHRQQTETLIMYSRTRLQEVLLRDIVIDLLDRNKDNLALFGLQVPDASDIEIELYTEMEQMKQQAQQQQISDYRGDQEKIV